jgi:hypothetical protein
MVVDRRELRTTIARALRFMCAEVRGPAREAPDPEAAAHSAGVR